MHVKARQILFRETLMALFFKSPSRLLLILLFVSPFNSYATTEYDIPTDNSVLMAPNAMDSIYDFLGSKNWSEGQNFKNRDAKTGQFFLAVGSASILERRDSKNYIGSRNNAFDRAFLQAKKSMVEFLEAEIKTSMKSHYAEPSDSREEARIQRLVAEGLALESARAQGSAIASDVRSYGSDVGSQSIISAGTEAERLLIAEINNALRERGFDPNRPVNDQELEKILTESSFQKSIEVVANARIAGAQVYKTFEVLPDGNQGDIGVVLIYSKKLHQLANAIYSFNFASLPQDAPRKRLKDQIPTDPAVLLGTFGVNMKIDSNGYPALIAYGQAAPRTNSSNSLNAAYNKAITNAQGLIRTFAGEIVETGSKMDASESMKELVSNKALVNNDDSYEESISSVTDSLKINFQPPLHRWRFQHPLTGHVVAGVVISWTVSGAEWGRDIKEQAAIVPPKNTGASPDTQTNDQGKEAGSGDVSGNAKEGTYSSEGATASDDF
jgi:hypothetical protein